MTDHRLEEMLDDLVDLSTDGIITGSEACLLDKAIGIYAVTGHLPPMQVREVTELHSKYCWSPEHG